MARPLRPSSRHGGVRTRPSQSGKADVRSYYQRHLPHQVPEGFPIFLTWNLKGSLPQRVLAALERERERLEKETRRSGESFQDRKIRHAKVMFAKRDRYLDAAAEGPKHLEHSAAAKIVADSIVWGVPERYELYAYAVMPNHAHVLFTPKVDLEICSQGIKGYTAYQINALQHERGRVFWQDESYDHWARDEAELHRIIAYIENNPVAAGLCAQPDEWPWSSAAWREKLNWKLGETFRPEWKPIVAGTGTSAFPG